MTPQGKIAVYVYFVFSAAILGTSMLLSHWHPTAAAVIALSAIFIATVVLFVIFYKKGPRPKSRWGQSLDDNPDEDL